VHNDCGMWGGRAVEALLSFKVFVNLSYLSKRRLGTVIVGVMFYEHDHAKCFRTYGAVWLRFLSISVTI